MTHPIVTAARGWIGTRFHHQGRIRKTGEHKGGVDCLGLLAGVAMELDLRGPDGKPLIAADETDYPHMPDTEYLVTRLSELLAPVPPSIGGRLGGGHNWHCFTHSCPHPNPPPTGEGIIPGDILLLCIDESPQHLGIVSDMENGLGLIHAYAPARAVVEHALDNWWQERIEAVFRLQ